MNVGETSQLPDYEVGDLVQVRVTGVEKEGYTVEVIGFIEVFGYYPCKSEIEIGTRLETCFVCVDKGKILLAPKSFLKQRQQLTAEEDPASDASFSPHQKIASPDAGQGELLDFSPPSDFSSDFIGLMKTWRLISNDLENELRDKLKSGKWEIVGLLKRLDIFTPQELASIDFGRNLLKREKISWVEFKHTFFDEVSVGIIFEDSKLVKSKK